MKIWDSKQIQMKKLLTTKFYNFLRSITLVSSFLHWKSFEKFEIQMWGNSAIIFLEQMISNE
jgi:hypothetical protein